MALISLIAPTFEDRIAMIAREAEGFLYVVSSLGVTGTRSEIKTDLASMVETVWLNTKIPAAIGFGISTPEQAKKMGGDRRWRDRRVCDRQAVGAVWNGCAQIYWCVCKIDESRH